MASGEVERRGEKSYWGVITSTPCDSCGSSPSVLFCRSDSAFLCAACDSRVHSANRLASRHDRVPLCQVCDRAPAAVACRADAASLCSSCDADIHSANPLAARHERVPVAPLPDPSSSCDDGDVKTYSVGRPLFGAEEGEGVVVDDFDLMKSADYFFADADRYVDLDHADSQLVPVQPEKAHHVSVGGAPAVRQAAASFDFAAPQPSYSSYSVCSSDVGVVPDAVGDAPTGYAGGRPGAQASVDREARVMRYREKRKNRKFEKTIRYASRKAYAETRPRIKGRFAKRAEAEAEVEGLYSSPAMVAGMMGDGGYGIVPSF